MIIDYRLFYNLFYPGNFFLAIIELKLLIIVI